jgi:hypothetical protein
LLRIRILQRNNFNDHFQTYKSKNIHPYYIKYWYHIPLMLCQSMRTKYQYFITKIFLYQHKNINKILIYRDGPISCFILYRFSLLFFFFSKKDFVRLCYPLGYSRVEKIQIGRENSELQPTNTQGKTKVQVSVVVLQTIKIKIIFFCPIYTII